MEYFIFNGKFIQGSANILSASNRGLRFGDGIFETIKSIDCDLQFIDEHFARLWKGLQTLQFIIPKHFSPDKLQNEITGLLQKNGHIKMARVRLTVFRGDGGLFDEIDNKPNYLIQTWALSGDTGTWNSNGLVLGIYSEVKKSCDILSNLKHNNFLPYALAALHAKKEKWNDSLILNTNDRLCDTSIANIFLIKDKVIYTPALQEGCIAGIMRKEVIRRLHPTPEAVVEGKLSVDDLYNADEVFLTNSIYNLRWVKSVDEKIYTNQYTQKIFSSLFPTN
jgi:branched-chain amino acid aminotransferase